MISGSVVLKIPHPIPYQGSKRRIAAAILRYVPVSARFVEPFAGSAAMSLAVAAYGRSDSFLLNDINAPLIELWSLILEHPSELADSYEYLWEEQIGEESWYYNQVRDDFNQYHYPHLFLFLLAKCVKGAVRHNIDGDFNQSPDKRRLGMRPKTMRKHLEGASQLLSGRSVLWSEDYRFILDLVNSHDIVYMDPPYQGISRKGTSRYYASLDFNELVDSLEVLNTKGVCYIVSYDGRTGQKVHGEELPSCLGLTRLSIDAGLSAQATLNGYQARTIESLYLSPSLANEAEIPHQVALF